MKTNTLLTMLITALFLLPVITICQVPDIKFSCKVGKHTPTGPTDNNLLYGQLSTPSNEGPVASQDFNDSTAYSCQAADDFTVSEGETWLIDEIFISGQYSPDGGPASAAHLFIYLIDTLTNAPGVLVAELIDFPVTASPDGDLTFNIQQAPAIDPITLEQGHYWISVQPHMPYTPYKQWYWKKQENGPPNDDYPLHWRNPDGGFGLPYPDWTPSTVVFEGTLDHNLAFAIYGEKMVCPVVDAGEDATLCEGESFTASATAGNTCGLMWTTNGDGTFDNTGSASATYIPGIADIDLGGATLCLIGQACAPCTQNAQDCLEITIQEQPSVFAGNDFTVCEGDQVIFSEAAAINYGTLQWITTNGFGDFDNENILNPTYTPSPMDYAQGCISMALSVGPIIPCTNYVIDFINVCFQPPPTADAGEDATIQEGEDYKLSATASNTCGLIWTTSGDGSFDDDVSLSATYIPGVTDIANGSVTLCLSGAACAPCAQGIQDCLELTIEALPFVNAGSDATICVDPSKKTIGGKGCFPLTGIVTGTFNALQWYTINGTGYFDNEHTLSTCYYYSPFDVLQGPVIIVLAVDYKGSKSSLSDSMILTFQEIPTVDAGEDATICGELAYPLADANAANYADLLWVTYGTGTFSDPYSLNPTYSPSMIDIMLGSVELCLNAAPINPCETGVSDCIILTLLDGPTADAGEDATICGELAYPLADANAANYAHLLWVTYGTGTFSDPYSLNPTYTPSMIDIMLGSVELCLNAAPIDPCVSGVSDCMILTLLEGPTADAGEDATICGELAYPLADANAANYAHLLWVTYGTGTFSDPYSLNPTYSPSMIDIMLGSVELCLNAAPMDPCVSGVSDCMILTLLEGPTADAGEDATICGESAYPLADANAANYAHLLWVTYGTGTFSDPYSLNPTYSPSMIDIMLGSVELCLNAAPMDPCVSGVSDCMILTLLEGPTADAGEDATICGELAYTLADANAANYAHLLWVSYGTGTFSDSYSLNPTYSPSMIDIMLGSVELCLNAAPINPCETGMSDCMILTLLEGPTADAGEDATICGELAYPLADANAANYNHLLWVTYGTGTFSDPYSLNPTYTPSMIDIMLGSAELCLNAAPINPCETGVSDCVTLTFESGQQTVQVPSGWCGISTYLELHPGDLETILDPVIDDLVILYNFSGIFYPEYGIFTIDEWDTYSGYVGKFSSPTSLNFMGCDLENKTVHLNQAWNIIPVLSDQAYSVEDLFAGKDNLQIVKEVAGTGIYWPAYSINTLGNVLPGKAYYARMSAADSIDYANPGKALSTIKPPDLSALVTPWNLITQTPSSHIVVLELSENGLFENDIIGGFTTDGTCAGLIKIQDASLPFAISLNADDPYITEKTGFTSSELIAFKLFRSSTGEVFDLEVSYKPAFDHSGLFVPNGVSVVYDVKLSPAGISNSSKHELNIYPNPSNGTFTIEGIHEKINVRIFNAFGEEIYLNELNLPARVDLSAQPNGMYFIRIETHNRIFFEKLVIN